VEQRVTRRLCLALDLADDPQVIADYERWHRPGGPPQPVTDALRQGGIEEMEIYRAANRLFLVMDVSEGYSAEAVEAAGAGQPEVARWAERMAALQRPIPGTGAASWAPMSCIYRLSDQP
jgi:L-rhamnose mutarotase